jgi:hypothetical protein
MSLDEYKLIYGKESIISEFRFKQLNTMQGRKRPDHSENMVGKNNPMFGKKRSLKEKELISKNRKNKGLGISGKYQRTYEIRTKIRNSLIKYFESLPKKDKTEFKKYWNSVWRETRKWISVLFEQWDGKCYYTEIELITDTNKFKDKNYRTVDHKISIIFGFKNNISPNTIGGIDNLCICSRSFNCAKRGKTIYQQIIYQAEKLL